MGDGVDISFCELRTKEIVNIIDGKKLGRLVDIIFDCESARIKGIVAPFAKKVFLFKQQQDIFIPWKCIKRIGEDTILIELKGGDLHDDKKDGHGHDGGHKHSGYPPPFHFCDRNCTKCSFNDCPARWEGKSAEAQYREFYQGEVPTFEK